MLAQNFMTAADLGISEAQLDALRKTLVLFETGKMRHVDLDEYDDDLWWSEEPPPGKFDGLFNLGLWTEVSKCGTVGCLGGTAELISGVKFRGWQDNLGLSDLFNPEIIVANYDDVTAEQAGRALRNYLTFGDAKWAEVIA